MGNGGALKITRREFLKLTGLSAAATLLAKYGVDVLSEKETKALSSELEFVPNICGMCSTACDILVASKLIDGKRVALKIEGDPKSGYNMGKVCARGQSGIRRQYGPNRIKKPLIRDDPNTKGTWAFREAEWDEALNFIKTKLQEKTGGDLSKIAFIGGWVTCVNYRPFMLGLLRRVNAGTGQPVDPDGIGWIVGPPMQHCVFASGLGIDLTLGIFNNHAEVMADFENSDYILLIRANSSVAGVSVPRGERLALARKNGAKIVVVDPRFSETAALATEWLKIKPGTDSAFLLAIINVILEEGLHDEEFLANYTNAPFLAYEPTQDDPVPQLATDTNGNYLVYDELTGNIVPLPKEASNNLSDANNNPIRPALEAPANLTYNGKTVKTVFQYLRERVENYTPEWAAEICDIPAETIRRIAEEFGKAARPTTDPSWYDGRYENSFMTNKLKAILMALKGMIDKEGGWVYTAAGRVPVMKWNQGGAPRQATSLPGVLPVIGLLKLMAWPTPDKVPAMFPAMSDVPLHAKVAGGQITVLIVAGANPIVNMYPKDKWENTLKNTFVVSLDIEANDSHLYADVILPESSYLERVDIVKPGESLSVELVTRFPAADPPEGAEPKHFLTILGYLLDIFKEISNVTNPDMKTLWFNKVKGIFGLSTEEAAVFDQLVDKEDNEKLPENFQKFFAWLFASRMGLCTKLGLQNCDDPNSLAQQILDRLKEGPIEVIPKEVALETKNIPRSGLQVSTPTGRIEIFSTIMYEAYQNFKNRFGYKAAWDPLLDWPGVEWKSGVDGKWSPMEDDEFFVTTGKVPLMSFTSTTNVDLLINLASFNPMYYWVWIHKDRADKLGIKTGDLIEITETKTNKKVQARAYVTDLIREDTIFIPINYKGKFEEQVYYKEFYDKYGPFVNLTELLPYQFDNICTAYRSNEFTVKIKKAGA